MSRKSHIGTLTVISLFSIFKFPRALPDIFLKKSRTFIYVTRLHEFYAFLKPKSPNWRAPKTKITFAKRNSICTFYAFFSIFGSHFPMLTGIWSGRLQELGVPKPQKSPLKSRHQWWFGLFLQPPFFGYCVRKSNRVRSSALRAQKNWQFFQNTVGQRDPDSH